MDTVTANKDTKKFIAGLRPTTILFPSELIEKARRVIENTDVPTTRNEAWKYTRLGRLAKIDFKNQQGIISDITKYKTEGAIATFVFVNGHFDASLSDTTLPDTISWKLLSDCNDQELSATNLALDGELFNAINTAYLNDGLLLSVKDKAEIHGPVQILHIANGEQTNANFRTIIQQDAFSKLEIIQGFYSEKANACFVNSTTDVSLQSNAQLTIHKIQFEDESSFHINTEKVNQEKDSIFTLNTITLNGGLVRNNVKVDVNGQNCETHLNGAYILKNKQHVDNHTTVDHKVAHCVSNELYKGVIDDQATAVFNGKVFVRKDAQKINAFQSNGNVLLTDDATVNSKPELEIYADDVKCSHGSTTGQLDDEAIFYLRARGISEKSARQLMIGAFTGEVLENISNPLVLNKVHELIEERFGWEF